jgi:methyl-accepting chemotaxis protein
VLDLRIQEVTHGIQEVTHGIQEVTRGIQEVTHGIQEVTHGTSVSLAGTALPTPVHVKNSTRIIADSTLAGSSTLGVV